MAGFELLDKIILYGVLIMIACGLFVTFLLATWPAAKSEQEEKWIKDQREGQWRGSRARSKLDRDDPDWDRPDVIVQY